MVKPHHARKGATFSERLQWRHTRIFAFLALFAITALLGGGSRSDVTSLAILRPLATLFGGLALLVMPPGQLREFRGPLLLVAATVAVIAWQLVPLPPSVWHQLPFRDAIVDIDRIVGLEHSWRPAALSPSGAWNALFSLVVPTSALLAYIALDPRDRSILIPAIIGFAFVSAFVGLMQMLGDPGGPLYFYAITNAGLPVGLFSNRNHHAILLACAMPALALWASGMASRARWAIPVCVAGELLLLLVVLLTGSRAGLLAAAFGAIAAVWGLIGRTRVSDVARSAPAPGWQRRPLLAGAALVTVAGVISLLLAFDRGMALERLLATDPETEMRVQAFPVVLDMIRESWLFGVGPGSFPGAFAVLEPTDMLGPNYLNHAHNDWIEIWVELGLPGVVVLMSFIALALKYILRLSRSPTRLTPGQRIATIAPLVIFAASSIVDYPLRTPSLATVALLWLAAMGDVQRRLLGQPLRRS